MQIYYYIKVYGKYHYGSCRPVYGCMDRSDGFVMAFHSLSRLVSGEKQFGFEQTFSCKKRIVASCRL